MNSPFQNCGWHWMRTASFLTLKLIRQFKLYWFTMQFNRIVNRRGLSLY
jgi:hypothetical protein